MDVTADLPAMLADFGVSATIGGVAVTGIFDNGYAAALGGLVAGRTPTLLLPTAAASPALGDPVTVGGATYTVAEIQPDGTGVTTLVLEAA